MIKETELLIKKIEDVRKLVIETCIDEDEEDIQSIITLLQASSAYNKMLMEQARALDNIEDQNNEILRLLREIASGQ